MVQPTKPGQTDRQTDGRRHTIIRPVKDGRIKTEIGHISRPAVVFAKKIDVTLEMFIVVDIYKNQINYLL